jgi:hypothetical protein
MRDHANRFTGIIGCCAPQDCGTKTPTQVQTQTVEYRFTIMREKLLRLMAWVFRVPYHPPAPGPFDLPPRQ